jgi:hypothetical protein
MKVFIHLKFFCLLILVFTSATVFAQTKGQKEILKVMRLEEEYWNRGDIEAYVSLYDPSDSTRMLLSNRMIYGKDSILAFYKKYWPKERMGQLTLEADGIEKLSRKYYYVSGFFHVKLAEKTVNGRFSGLMKKVKGKWYLYTDHSS